MDVGIHILLNLFNCNETYLKKVSFIQDVLNKAVEESALTKVGETFHQFNPCGVTGVLLLSESHICIHTWPEFNMAAIDIFSCGDKSKAQKAADYIIKCFSPQNYDLQILYR